MQPECSNLSRLTKTCVLPLGPGLFAELCEPQCAADRQLAAARLSCYQSNGCAQIVCSVVVGPHNSQGKAISSGLLNERLD